MQQPNLEIMNFVEQQILPRYNAFGKSHGLSHVQRVIKNSLALAAVTGADVNMVYVIAAYLIWVWKDLVPFTILPVERYLLLMPD